MLKLKKKNQKMYDFHKCVNIGRKYIHKYFNELKHHGINGMRWGVRNGPPYPLNKSTSSYSKLYNKNNLLGKHINYKTARLSKESYLEAKRLDKLFDRLPLPQKEWEILRHELNTNMSDEQKEMPLFPFDCGDNEYIIINFGFDNYKPIDKIPLDDVNIHEISDAINSFKRRT